MNFDLDATERAPRRVAHPAGARVDARLANRGPRRVLHEHGVTRDQRGLHQREEEQHEDREHERELDGRLTVVGTRG